MTFATIDFKKFKKIKNLFNEYFKIPPNTFKKNILKEDIQKKLKYLIQISPNKYLPLKFLYENFTQEKKRKILIFLKSRGFKIVNEKKQYTYKRNFNNLKYEKDLRSRIYRFYKDKKDIRIRTIKFITFKN